MASPEGVKKHDGRIVAFDAARLAASITRAASSGDGALSLQVARRIGSEIGSTVAAFLMKDGKPSPASADIRAYTIEILRQTGQPRIADSYAEHSRMASDLLWRLRVAEPGTLVTTPGAPWDRRRLLESLRAGGIARDPAGEMAREVERRVVALGQERISPALIHALTALVLAQRNQDGKTYAARRIAYSMTPQAPRFDPLADDAPLPSGGPALGAFWLQAVHSPDVVRAVHDNLLSLSPYPTSPKNETPSPASAQPQDPLSPEINAAIGNWTRGANSFCVRCDSAEPIAHFSRLLAMLPLSQIPPTASGVHIDICLDSSPHIQHAQKSSAPAITINVAGLMLREALREQTRATVRLAQTASLAVKAHRQREEYFNLSPVRGRQLPVAVAGVWNAACWLSGEGFESTRMTRATRTLAATLISVVRGALETLRNESGMELLLTASTPPLAARELWQSDRQFFLRDGVVLDAAASYAGGVASRLCPGEDLSERLDFARAASETFDEPPSVSLEVPLGHEGDAALWRECITLFAQSGVPRMRLVPGGSSRGLRLLLRLVRSHLEGFPLFEQI